MSNADYPAGIAVLYFVYRPAEGAGFGGGSEAGAFRCDPSHPAHRLIVDVLATLLLDHPSELY